MAEEREYLKFESPEFLRTLSYDQLEDVCQKIRQEIILSCSEFGGHLSSNLGDVEAIVALNRMFDFSKDKLIFDVGHQCYAFKLLTNRCLKDLNGVSGVAGFQKIKESPYDPWEAGHSSTSISAAEALAIERDAAGENYDVIAFIGDSSIANGLAFEGLNNIACRPNKVIIVLNDNGMSISKPVGGLGKAFQRISTGSGYLKLKSGFKRITSHTRFGRWFYRKTLNFKNSVKSHLIHSTIFDDMGFTYIGAIDGHDIKAMEKALTRAKRADKSVVLHIITQKGRGYRYAEDDQTGYWHGVTPFDIETGSPKSMHPGFISWSHYMADLTHEIMGVKPTSRLIVPATAKGSGLEKAFAAYPDRCFDVGIAEEHAATLCGGFAVAGSHPILSIYSTFLQRAYDEISHDCARMNANMTILVDRAGMVGKNGDTHQGIYDVAYLRSIPNVVITMPSTKAIAKALYYQSFDDHGIVAIRFPREMVYESEDAPYVELPFLRWKFDTRTDSKKLAILAVGPKEKEILSLAKAQYVDAEIIDPVYLFPILKDNLYSLMSFREILIYDAYGTKEGFADSVLSALMELGYQGKVHVRAIPNAFVQQGTSKQQLEQFGLLPEQIIQLAKELLAKYRHEKKA